jgi:hypothetical protein
VEIMHDYFDVFNNFDNAHSKRRLKILITHNEDMLNELEYLCRDVPELEDKYNKFMMEFDSLINSEAEYRSKFKNTRM